MNIKGIVWSVIATLTFAVLLAGPTQSQIIEEKTTLVLRGLENLPGTWADEYARPMEYIVQYCRPGDWDSCVMGGMFPGGRQFSRGEGAWEEVRNWTFTEDVAFNHGCGRFLQVIRMSFFDQPERVFFRAKRPIECNATNVFNIPRRQ